MNSVIFFSLSVCLAVATTAFAEPEMVFHAPHNPAGIVPVKSLNIPSIDFAKYRAEADKGTPSSGPTFTVVYQDVLDNTNAGFDDPTLGAARRAVVDEVTAYLSTVIKDTGNCDIYFQLSENADNGFLGFAGTNYFLTSSFQGGLAFEHITTGVDPSPTNPDITGQINFFYPYNLNTATATSGGNYDLFSVLLHEVTHGLGILSAASATGASRIGPGTYTTLDQLAFSSGGVRIWNDSQTYSGISLTGGNNTIQFRGTGTNTVFGQFPPLFTPATFANASSISHWQLAAPIPGNAVMRPEIAQNVDNRIYQPFEIAALGDLGYTISSSNADWVLYNY
ncbi:MAG: hypothetical protein ACFCU1_06215 [Sumerlaeia bacterium]